MKDIKQIIADNLISLRKKHGYTQNELAEMLNYSDNTVSRWEHAEITPSVETLEQIANIYNVPLEFLIKENIVKNVETDEKSYKMKKLMIVLLCVSMVWMAAVIAYFYYQSFTSRNPWTLFVWAVPLSCLVLMCFNNYINSRTYSFVFSTIFIWSTLASFYLQFLSYNLWLLFIIGIPAQMATSVFTYVRPRQKKKEKKQKTKED